jgi:Na+/proline symporter
MRELVDVTFVESTMTQASGYILLFAIFAAMLVLALIVRTYMVRSTHDFVIADRRVGLGFGVPVTIAAWTWAMAVMMSAGMTFRYGVSGLYWFTVANILCVIAVIPFASYLRRVMPQGYTISQYISMRFPGQKPTFVIFLAGMLFGCFLQIIINLKGTSLLISTIFGIDWRIVPILVGFIVTFYGYFGGMWTSAITGSIQGYLILVPGSVVVLAMLSKVGGPEAVFWTIQQTAPPAFLKSSTIATAFAFGISLGLGLTSNTITDQTFWQKIWAIKPRYVTKVFLHGGAWFGPIPIQMGILGLIGIAAGVDLAEHLGGDAAAVGPYLIAHLGLPTWVIITYCVVITSACFSTIDSAYVGTSSLVTVDIVKRLMPDISEKRLFLSAKLSIVAMGVLSVAVVLSGMDFISIVMVTYAIKTAVMMPLVLAVFWDRCNGWGCFAGITSAIVIGMPVYLGVGEFAGTVVIIGLSMVVPWIWSLIKPQWFDITALAQARDLTGVVRAIPGVKKAQEAPSS